MNCGERPSIFGVVGDQAASQATLPSIRPRLLGRKSLFACAAKTKTRRIRRTHRTRSLAPCAMLVAFVPKADKARTRKRETSAQDGLCARGCASSQPLLRIAANCVWALSRISGCLPVCPGWKRSKFAVPPSPLPPSDQAANLCKVRNADLSHWLKLRRARPLMGSVVGRRGGGGGGRVVKR